jgi:hypothetical protein
MRRPGALRIKPAESSDSLLIGGRGLRTKHASGSFAEEVRQAMLRDLRKATARGEDVLTYLVRREIEDAYRRSK